MVVRTVRVDECVNFKCERAREWMRMDGVRYGWELLERIEWWGGGGVLEYVALERRYPSGVDKIEVWLYPDRHELCTGYLGSKWVGAGKPHYGGQGCIELPLEELKEIANMMLNVSSFDDYAKVVRVARKVPITARWHD